MNTFDLVVQVFPVALVPELILSLLGGDDCLDCLDSAIMNRIFTTKYTEQTRSGTFNTFLDEDCNIFHSFDDQPASVAYGTKIWCFNGKLHRDGDKPAKISGNDHKTWFHHGVEHRDSDQPAWIHIDGGRRWFKYGKLHRDGDKPAVMFPNGWQEWYKDGELYQVKYGEAADIIRVIDQLLTLKHYSGD